MSVPGHVEGSAAGASALGSLEAIEFASQGRGTARDARPTSRSSLFSSSLGSEMRGILRAPKAAAGLLRSGLRSGSSDSGTSYASSGLCVCLRWPWPGSLGGCELPGWSSPGRTSGCDVLKTSCVVSDSDRLCGASRADAGRGVRAVRERASMPAGARGGATVELEGRVVGCGEGRRHGLAGQGRGRTELRAGAGDLVRGGRAAARAVCALGCCVWGRGLQVEGQRRALRLAAAGRADSGAARAQNRARPSTLPEPRRGSSARILICSSPQPSARARDGHRPSTTPS